MVLLKNIQDEEVIISGSILRLYNVNRYDIMKTIEDRENIEKQSADYYDIMLVDSNLIKSNTFLLINITVNSDNKGKIFGVIENTHTGAFLYSLELKQYFSDLENLYLL